MATFSRALVRGRRLKLWKTKPILWFRSRARLSADMRRHFLPFEPIFAGSRTIQAPQDVHEGAFARTRCAHQGDQFSLGHVERHSLEHGDVDVAQSVILTYFTQFY